MRSAAATSRRTSRACRRASPRRTTGKAARDGNRARYVTDLLSDPATRSISRLHAARRSRRCSAATRRDGHRRRALVCYPTRAGNPRADYPLPNGNVDPAHAARRRGADLSPEQRPLSRAAVLARLAGSPIVRRLHRARSSMFASYGYVVVAPFHGDLRFADVELDDLRRRASTRCCTSRTSSRCRRCGRCRCRAALDAFLAHPDWRDHVDPDRIGGFGASLGGESMLLHGRRAADDDARPCRRSRCSHDPRIKAAVGYVPYFGMSIYPAFGRDQQGLDGVTLPYPRAQRAPPTRRRRSAPIERRHAPAARHAPARCAAPASSMASTRVLRRHLHLVAQLSRRAAHRRSASRARRARG